MQADNFNKVGYEGDSYVHDELEKLVKAYGVDTIIETGTFHGNTTARLAELVDKVVTIESQPTYFNSAYFNLKKKGFDVDKFENGRIWMVQAHSQDVLTSVALRTRSKCILYFLDAHWEGDWPLLAELKHIANIGFPAVIVIHDFKVPGKNFGYDSYAGQDLDFEYIESALPAIYPDGYDYHYNSEASGHNRGLIYIYPKQVIKKEEVEKQPAPKKKPTSKKTVSKKK